MPKKTFIASLVVLSTLLLGACNLPFVVQPAQQQPTTSSMDLVNTLAAKTVQALETKLAEASNPTQQAPTLAAVASVTSAPSATPLSSSTPLVISTSTPAPTSAPAATGTTAAPCDRAQFVADITVPDGTNYAANTTFTKTWRLKNNGSCTWTTSYSLVFDSGNALQGLASTKLPSSVAPGGTIDLSIALKAPASDGYYKGNWKLQNASGARFGVGVNANQSFYVEITVGSGITSTPGTATAVATGSCLITGTSPAAYTNYSPGGDFDAKWTVKNNGSSTWSKDAVDFKYISGTKMYKRTSGYDLSADVASGSSIDLIVDSIAPSSAGTYSMTWALMQGTTTLCNMTVTIRVQ